MSNKKEDQNIFGFFMAILFSLAGLFTAFLYPAESKERLTLIEGWKGGYIFRVIIVAVIALIYLFSSF